jgi:enoyl-CoA hydratase/carnithine racemase
VDKDLMTASVLFEELATKNGQVIGLVTLNSEKTLNSLTLEMVERMLSQLKKWQSDKKVAALFIQGAGDKALCAGGDVQALRNSSIEQPGGPCEYAEAFFECEYRLDYLLHNYNKPTIVWGHGIVMGGGLGVFAACEYRVATERTRIAMPEVTIALFPDVGGSYFLNRMPGQCGRFLALTAASINGADSVYVGIADYTVSHVKKQTVMDFVTGLDWVGDNAKDTLNNFFTEQHASSVNDMPASNLEKNKIIINQLCSGDNAEVIAQRFMSLDSEDKWMVRAKGGIGSGSPLAIKWILHQLEVCKDLTLKSVFEKEILLATNIVRHTEFAEGVRALLVDKDQNPQWQFKQLNDVTEDAVASFFKAPWSKNPLADM